MKLLRIIGTVISVLFATILLSLFVSLMTGIDVFAQEQEQNQTVVVEGDLPLTVEFQYAWLSPKNYQQLTENEQRAIVAATRDVVVYATHALDRHEMEDCVKIISNEELEAIKNSVDDILASEVEFNNSVVSVVTNFLTALCSIEPEPDSDSASETPE